MKPIRHLIVEDSGGGVICEAIIRMNMSDWEGAEEKPRILQPWSMNGNGFECTLKIATCGNGVVDLDMKLVPKKRIHELLDQHGTNSEHLFLVRGEKHDRPINPTQRILSFVEFDETTAIAYAHQLLSHYILGIPRSMPRLNRTAAAILR